jgi:thiol-disulfide isomerase/thioredoxin
MQNKKIFIVCALVLFAIAGAVGYAGPGWLKDRRMAQEREAFIPAGVPVRVADEFSPQFETMLKATEPKRLPDVPFLDKDGKEVRIADFAGKPTLVNLWATWCTPCVVELPSLQKLGEYYKGQLNIVALNVEEGKDPAQILSFLEKREVGDFAAYVDKSGAFGKNLGLRGIPTSFLIGSDGLILYRFEGDADWTTQTSKAFFDIFLLQKR